MNIATILLQCMEMYCLVGALLVDAMAMKIVVYWDLLRVSLKLEFKDVMDSIGIDCVFVIIRVWESEGQL